MTIDHTSYLLLKFKGGWGWGNTYLCKHCRTSCASSEEPDETAHNEPPHQDLLCHTVLDFLTPSATMGVSKIKVHFKNSAMKGFKETKFSYEYLALSKEKNNNNGHLLNTPLVCEGNKKGCVYLYSSVLYGFWSWILSDTESLKVVFLSLL